MFNSSLMIKSGLLFIILATALPINSPAYAGIIGLNYPNQNSFQETIKQQREKREQQRQAPAEVRRLGLYDQAQLQQQLRQQQQQLQQQLRQQQERLQQQSRQGQEQLQQRQLRLGEQLQRQEQLRQEQTPQRREELRRELEDIRRQNQNP